MAEGQTATNPQTGERVVLRGGQWVPVGGGQRPQARQAAALPRGLRNNNPGNIEDGDYARSLPGYAGSDGRFAIFDSPDAGGQAKTRLLGSYINRGFNTPASIINRWAPPSDNNPTEAYADYVARRAGIGVNDQVTQEQIPLIAQAISEFENGNTANFTSGPMPQQAAPTSVQTATNPQTGEKMQLVDGQWQPVERSQQNLAALAAQRRFDNRASAPDIGALFQKPWLQREITRYMAPNESIGPDGVPEVDILPGIVRSRTSPDSIEIYDPDSGAYYKATEDDVRQYEAMQRQSQQDRQARLERSQDPEYQRALADARRGSENVPDQLRAVGLGGTLGFLTDINAEAQGLLQGLENAGRKVSGQEIEYGADMARQAARDAVRDDQAKYAAENPIENFALQAAGGLLTPGLAAGGNYIAAANGAGKLARAGQVGAAYGALSGAGNSSGNLLERAPDAVQGGGVGALTGVVGQGLLGRLTNGADKKVSNARLLSREGVDLTPGQMVSEVPVIGGMLRSLEEGASSIPFAGAPIAGARQQSVETFNRAAVNRALAPIGGKLPKKVQPGYDAVEYAQNALGEAYDAVLPRVTARLGDTMYDDLGRILNRSAEEMDEPKLRQLTNIVQNRVFRGIEEADGVISGEQFKRIESELGALAREQQNALDPANKALGRAIEDVRGAVRDVIARQNPDEAQTIQNINRGYANLVRVEDAAGSSAAQATGGVFSPVQLGAAAKRGSTRSQSARGGALLQDLSAAGRDIIPSRVGDSGTATRGAVTGLLAGAASGVPVAGAVAAPLIATSALYSKPAQAALNAAYRATDSRAAREAVQELARLAQRNPALLPYYEGALEHVQRLSQDTTPNTIQAQPGLLAASPSQ